MNTVMNDAELNNILRKLNLSGMLENLDQRNQEAITNQMNYPEFLNLLAHDELLLRERRRYERCLKKADFKGKKSIENFDFSFNPNINQRVIRDLATCRFVEEKYPVLIMGPCGTGKSHLAQALGRCAVERQLRFPVDDHYDCRLRMVNLPGFISTQGVHNARRLDHTQTGQKIYESTITRNNPSRSRDNVGDIRANGTYD